MVLRINCSPSLPCGRGVEYTDRFPACRMRRLKECPNGSTNTAWDYVVLLCKLYRPGCRSKTLPLFSNLSYPIPIHPLLHMVQHVANWVALFPGVSVPLLLPSNSSILLLHLPSVFPSYMHES